MSCFSKCEPLAQSEQIGRTKAFRKALNARPPREVVDRQARISMRAFSAYVDRADALGFLNRHNDVLGGRPLDVAGRDEPGLVAASAALQGAASAEADARLS